MIYNSSSNELAPLFHKLLELNFSCDVPILRNFDESAKVYKLLLGVTISLYMYVLGIYADFQGQTMLNLYIFVQKYFNLIINDVLTMEYFYV